MQGGAIPLPCSFPFSMPLQGEAVPLPCSSLFQRNAGRGCPPPSFIPFSMQCGEGLFPSLFRSFFIATWRGAVSLPCLFLFQRNAGGAIQVCSFFNATQSPLPSFISLSSTSTSLSSLSSHVSTRMQF